VRACARDGQSADREGGKRNDDGARYLHHSKDYPPLDLTVK